MSGGAEIRALRFCPRIPLASALQGGCNKQRKPYSDDGSTSFRFGYGDRAANLTHEDRHVAGSMFFGIPRRVRVLYAHTIVCNRQFDFVANPFYAQQDAPRPVRKRVLDGIGGQLIDQKAERYAANRGTIAR